MRPLLASLLLALPLAAGCARWPLDTPDGPARDGGAVDALEAVDASPPSCAALGAPCGAGCCSPLTCDTDGGACVLKTCPATAGAHTTECTGSLDGYPCRANCQTPGSEEPCIPPGEAFACVADCAMCQ